MTKNLNSKNLKTILKILESGVYYSKSLSKQDDIDYISNLKSSLIEHGQLFPIFIKITYESDQPTVTVIKGNTRLKIINELRSQKLWKSPIKFEIINDNTNIYKIFSSASFVSKNYSKFQKALFGAKIFYDEIANKAKHNQITSSNGNNPINTAKEVAKICNTNEKYVCMAKKLLNINLWFYDYLYLYNAKMAILDISKLLSCKNKSLQRNIVEYMIEMYKTKKYNNEKIYTKAFAKAIKEDESCQRKLDLATLKASLGNEVTTLNEIEIIYKKEKEMQENESTKSNHSNEQKTLPISTVKEFIPATGNVPVAVNVPATENVQIDNFTVAEITTNKIPTTHYIHASFEINKELEEKIITICKEAGYTVKCISNSYMKDVA